MTEERTRTPGRYSKLTDFLPSDTAEQAKSPGIPRITLPTIDRSARGGVEKQAGDDPHGQVEAREYEMETPIPSIASLDIETPIPPILALDRETPLPQYAVNLQVREDMSEIATLEHRAIRVASPPIERGKRGSQDYGEAARHEQRARREGGGLRWQDFRYLRQVVAPFQGLIWLALLLAIGVGLTALPMPFLLRILLDEAFPRRDVTRFCWVLLGLLATFLLEELLRFLARRTMGALSRAANLHITYRLYRHLLFLALPFHEGLASTGQVADQINEMNSAQQTIIQTILDISVNICIASIYLCLLLLTNWRLTLAAAGVALLSMLISLSFNRQRQNLDKSVFESYAAMNNALYEGLLNVKAIKALAAEHRFARIVKRLIIHTNQLSARRTLVQSKAHLMIGVAQTISILIVLSYGGYLIVTGALTMGQLAAFALLLRALASPLAGLQSMPQQIEATKTTLRRLCIVLNRPTEAPTEQGIALRTARGHVMMRHVHFSYEPGQEILHDINLDVPAGTTIAIVGKSDVNKTALANLLLRFYAPDYGTICIDRCDIRDVQLDTLRKQFGVLSQDEALFSGTIEENLTLGLLRKVPFQELVEAARNANMLDFILQQPLGFKTVLKEGGQNLSRGQRQCLAIARLFLRQPAILLIEESPMPLDDESETLVQQALRLLRQGRTTFLLAHRLNTLREVDRIIVLDEGWIAEQGTHEELLARKGTYWRLYMNERL